MPEITGSVPSFMSSKALEAILTAGTERIHCDVIIDAQSRNGIKNNGIEVTLRKIGEGEITIDELPGEVFIRFLSRHGATGREYFMGTEDNNFVHLTHR